MDYWRNYIRTVATRYKGRIDAYEVWNEPNLTEFFTGSVDDMVSLTREAYTIIKETDPGALVVSPAVTGEYGLPYLNEFFTKAEGGKYFDVVGYHFYVAPRTKPPESMVLTITAVRSVMQKHGLGDRELWDTEAGWSKPKVFASPDEAAAWVCRAYLLNWAAGVSRFYWYQWDNRHCATLLMTHADRRTPTEAARAYGQTEKWLVGARIDYCKEDISGRWSCQISREGNLSWIEWHPRAAMTVTYPKGRGVKRAMALDGTERVIMQNIVEVGESPISLTR